MLILRRQSLLFSATISPEVKQIAQIYLRPEHKFISTVKESDDSTHEHVDQEFILLDAEWHLPMLAKFIVDSTQKDPNTKIICFFTTARATALAAAAVSHNFHYCILMLTETNSLEKCNFRSQSTKYTRAKVNLSVQRRHSNLLPLVQEY